MYCVLFFFSSRRRHTRCALVTGVQTCALPISLSRQAHVTAVDAAGNAMEALQQAANRFQRPVTARHRDLFRAPLDMKELQPFDAVVVDPPRDGARAQVEMIARSAVPRDRKRAGWGKRVSVRVDLGGGRTIKKKQK